MILEELIEKLQALPDWARNERVVRDDGLTSDRSIEAVEANYGFGAGVVILISENKCGDCGED